MKENCDWKKCLDRIEDKGSDDDDAYSEILEYIREVATVDAVSYTHLDVYKRQNKILEELRRRGGVYEDPAPEVGGFTGWLMILFTNKK